MPITDIAFVDEGKQWPPPSEKERTDRYKVNQKLWKGKHDDVYGNWWRVLREDQAAALELVFNWHKRLSTLWPDMMMSEPPRFLDGEDENKSHDKPQNPRQDDEDPGQDTEPPVPATPPAKPPQTEGKDTSETKPEGPSPVQDAIDRISGKETNSFLTTLYEIGLDISRFGDGLAKIHLKKEGADINAQPPSYWYPVTAPHDLREIQYHVLAWEFERTEDGSVRKYLWIEIHDKGTITRKVHKLNGNVIGEKFSVREFSPTSRDEEKTNIDEFLVIPFHGLRASDELFGNDDYSDLDSIVAALEVRAAQINKILDKHSDPSMYGPKGQVQINAISGQPEFKSGGRYVEVDGQEPVIPGYIVWDPSMEAQFRELDWLMEQLYVMSETSPAAFGQMKEGLVESGSALRRLMMAPLTKVARLAMTFDPAARQCLKVAAMLEAANGHATPPLDHVQIQWQDGLPEDPEEQARTEDLRTAHKQTSAVVSAIRRLDGGTQGEAEAEAERIAEEAAAAAASTLEQTAATAAIALEHDPSLALAEKDPQGKPQGDKQTNPKQNGKKPPAQFAKS